MIELVPIGRIHTPYQTLAACPKWPPEDGPPSRIEIFEPFRDGLFGFRDPLADVLYWFDRADRSRLRVISLRAREERGVFGVRSPGRPNPIALARVRVLDLLPDGMLVSGLDCLDGTAVIDLKPGRD